MKFKINIRSSRGICIVSMLSICWTSGCRKLVEVPPPVTSITQTNVFSTDATAISVITGLYINMVTNNTIFSGQGCISFYAGLSADELSLSSLGDVTKQAYFKNGLGLSNTTNYLGSEFWSPCYKNIFICNSTIEALNDTASSKLTFSVKTQLLGEAKFMRAFYYFYLVNFFGDLPLALTTDYTINRFLSRSPKTDVYHQIINDLKEAEQLLSSNYLNVTLNTAIADKVRPTKWAARALLARAYLYSGDFVNAEAMSTTLINSGQFNLSALNNTFLKNSPEAIWQLQPVGTTGSPQPVNTYDGYYLIIPSTGLSSTFVYSINSALLSSFEAGDLRAKPKNWIDTVRVGGILLYYPYKYKQNVQGTPTSVPPPPAQSEYLMMFRLAEQYLIRSEARAQQGNISGAQTDLNSIRARAGLSNTTAATQPALLIAIFHERQTELFTEWGHRWFDLKRTGQVDAVMTIQTPLKSNGAVQWNAIQQLYPIPYSDVLNDPNLKQNAGY